MQKAFTEWIESLLGDDADSLVYKTNFMELCKYKCSTNSLLKLYEDIDNLEKIVVTYVENKDDQASKSDFYYELSVFISRYKLNIRI